MLLALHLDSSASNSSVEGQSHSRMCCREVDGHIYARAWINYDIFLSPVCKLGFVLLPIQNTV